MTSYFVRCKSSCSILGLEGRSKASRRLLARGRLVLCGGAEHFANFKGILPLTLTNPYELSPKPKYPHNTALISTSSRWVVTAEKVLLGSSAVKSKWLTRLSCSGGKAKPLKAPKKEKKEMDEDEIAFREKQKAGACFDLLQKHPSLTLAPRCKGEQRDGREG